MDIKEQDILGNYIYQHWYYIAKGRALQQLIGTLKVECVLDIGAGSGIFSRRLLDAGICQKAVCIDPAYPQEYTELHHNKPITFLRSVQTKSPATTSPELVLMMDVLEHVEDDLAFLHQYTATMRPGSKILITVPAFQFLWSGHDVFLEHYRRYTGSRLKSVVQQAGIKIIALRYFFGLLLPVVVLLRLVNRIQLSQSGVQAKSDLKIYPPQVNHALIRIHDLERLCLFPYNRFAGLTVFCLGMKI